MDHRELLRQAFPSYGPDWDAAIEAGVDVSLLEENLRLSPTERLEQLQRMTELYEFLRPKGERRNSSATPSVSWTAHPQHMPNVASSSGNPRPRQDPPPRRVLWTERHGGMDSHSRMINPAHKQTRKEPKPKK
jgi:hypothetical protein